MGIGVGIVTKTQEAEQAVDPSPRRRLGRVCLVTSTFPRWVDDNTAPFVLHIAQDLTELGWQVDVLAPHAPGAVTDEIIGGISIHRFKYMWPVKLETVCYQGGALINLRENPLNWLKLPALVLCQWLALMRRLVSSHYDLVHSHWVLPQGFVGVLAAQWMKLPNVVTVHGSDVFGLRGALMTWFKRYALKRATAVTVNSSATHDAVLKIVPGFRSIHLIPMGVESKAVSGDPDPVEVRHRHRQGDGPLLIFVGRLVEEKGVDDLLRSIPLIVSNLPDVTALIIGDGQLRSSLEQMTCDLEITDRVKFLGWVSPDNIPNYLRAADIFVGPSKRTQDGRLEAQGLTFVEAMLNQIPVIATRCGGIVDLVQNEKTGLLVAEQSPQEIAAAVNRIVRDTALTARITEAANRLAIEGFTRSKTAHAFSALFEKLIVEHRASN